MKVIIVSHVMSDSKVVPCHQYRRGPHKSNKAYLYNIYMKDINGNES